MNALSREQRTLIGRSIQAVFLIQFHMLSGADRVYVSLGTAGTYPGYGPVVPRET